MFFRQSTHNYNIREKQMITSVSYNTQSFTLKTCDFDHVVLLRVFIISTYIAIINILCSSHARPLASASSTLVHDIRDMIGQN